MRNQRSMHILFLLFAALTGCTVAVIIWVFLKVCNLGVAVVWDYFPTYVDSPLYTMILCLFGGLIIGIFHKKYGDFPETIQQVIHRLKTEKRLTYKNIPIVMAATFLSLFFGGAVGPETGVVGVLAGLCFWAMDQLYMARDTMEELLRKKPGISGFHLFRFMAAGLLLDPQRCGFQKSTIWTKNEGILAAVSAVISGFILYELLNFFFGRCINIPHLDGGAVDKLDVLFLLILIAVGIFAGYLFMVFKKITTFFFGNLAKKGLTIINALLGGLALGLIGSFIPMTMFSGGNEIQIMQYEYLQYTPVLLIIIGVIKLLLTNICIQSGWKGGHFFPVIFSGLSIGYGMAILLDCNQILSVIVVCGALLGTITQQPLGALAISLLFFPVKDLGWIIVASFIGGCIPMPKPLRVDPNNRGFIYNISRGELRKKLPLR